MPDTILVGSYSNSIHSLEFTKPSSASAKDGKLTVGPSYKVTDGAGGPSWVIQHPTHKDIFYAVIEDEKDGQIFVGRLTDGKMKQEAVVSSGGGAPAHIHILNDASALVAANYMGSSCVIIPLLPNGLVIPEYKPIVHQFPFHPTSSPLRNLGRQDAPHPHQVVEVDVPGKGRQLWLPDLGGDRVHKMEISGEGANMKWNEVDQVGIVGDEGGGPRHILVSKDAKHLYIINELLPAVTHTDLSTSPPAFVSKTSIVPPPQQTENPVNKGTGPSSAELLLIPTKPNPTILASTRTLNDRETDTLALFDLDESTGAINLKDFVYPRKGREFRGVGVSFCGKYIVVTGQEDGWVSVFGQNEEGKWVEVVEEQVKLELPTHVLFI